MVQVSEDERLSLVHRQVRRRGGQPGGFGHELARLGDGEVVHQRLGALPLLEEDDPQLVLGIPVGGMAHTARLEARTAHVIEAQLENPVECVRLGFDASGDDDHTSTVGDRASPAVRVPPRARWLGEARSCGSTDDTLEQVKP